MNCPKCGSVLNGARFCSECGTVASDPSAKTVAVTDAPLAVTSSGSAQRLPDGLLELVRTDLAKEYEIQEEIGRGGMAVVYRAKEIELGRTVAIKVLPPEMALTASMAERFKREARMAASLDHPNIIPIYRVGTGGRLFYIAMKFVEGRTLDAIIAQQRALPVPVILQVMRGAAHAIAYAHERGIIHRDIKGANIMIQSDGRPVVSDFGIARVLSEKSLTVAGSVIGTPFFMSPEQCAGTAVGPQSDQYSLGIVGFEMLTGSVPFNAETLPEILQHHWFTEVPDVTAVRRDVPKELIAIIERCLAKAPADRFHTTFELARALDLVPVSELERHAGDAMLKQLASGKSVAKMRTNTLPPLAATMATRISGARSGPTAAMRRNRRRVVLGAGTGMVAAAAGLGIWFTGASRTAADGLGVPAASVVNPVASLSTKDSAAAPVPAVASTKTPVPAAVPARDAAEESKRAETKRLERARRDSIARVRTAEAAAAEPAGTGKIRLRTDPSDAQILIDGKSVGRGVLVDHEVAAGSHRLRITASGYLPFDTTITVQAGETTPLGRRTLTSQQP